MCMAVTPGGASSAGSVVGPTAALSSPATARAISSFLFIPGASLVPHARLPPRAEGPAVARSTLLSGSDDCNHQPSFAYWWATRRVTGPFWGPQGAPDEGSCQMPSARWPVHLSEGGSARAHKPYPYSAPRMHLAVRRDLRVKVEVSIRRLEQRFSCVRVAPLRRPSKGRVR